MAIHIALAKGRIHKVLVKYLAEACLVSQRVPREATVIFEGP